MDLNRVMFIGNMVNDPESRTTGTGKSVVNFRLATNRKWKDQATGEFREDSQFHTIVVWGKLAEICSQYMKKGMKVYVEGRLTHRSWDDQNTGQKKYFTEVVAENIIMLSQGRGGANGGSVTSPTAAPAAAAPAAASPQNNDVNIPAPEEIPTIDIDENQEEVNVKDIPF